MFDVPLIDRFQTVNIFTLCIVFSAGVGRTGTFIGLDYLLDCAEATGKVNVFDCVNFMRQQRVNMVQTIVSYALSLIFL